MNRTPIAASVALLCQPEILLIQRNREPSAGLWTLPGGRLEAGESAEQAAARELREELGLTAYGLRPVRTLLAQRGPDTVEATEVPVDQHLVAARSLRQRVHANRLNPLRCNQLRRAREVRMKHRVAVGKLER